MQLIGRAPARRSPQAGFTIPEILVVTALSAAVAGALISFNRFQLFALRNQASQVDLQTTARDIVDLFARDVRQAGINPTCNPDIQAVKDAKQQLLRVQADLDGDGKATSLNEDIKYEYKFSTNRLERSANGTTEALVEGLTLTGSRVRYFDGAGAEVTAGTTGLSGAQRDNVRRIRIELVLTRSAPDPQNPAPLRVRIANDVNLRNRYFVNRTDCS